MAALLGIVLALIIVAVIVTPFLRGGNRANSPQPNAIRPQSDDVDLKRIYGEIRTIRSEFDAGNLTDAEFIEQLGELRVMAARALRDQDQRRVRDIEAELMIEREVQRARSEAQDDQDDLE